MNKAALYLSRKRRPASIHGQLYALSCALHDDGKDEGDAFDVVRAYANGCGREVPDREVRAAVLSARGERHEGKKWPASDPRFLAKFSGSTDMTELTEHDEPPAYFLQQLFSMDELVCAATCETQGATAPLAKWVDEAPLLTRCQFIVPSPMTAEKGINHQGKSTWRCDAITGPRRYLVIEFDNGTIGSQWARHQWLRRLGLLELVMVVFSGGKSLHGWYAADGEDACAAIFSRAVQIGADPKTWTRCQLVRMPNGIRSDGKRQQVLFF